MTKFTVISGSSSEDLAKKVAKKLGANLIKSELRVFPDGESKITLKGKPQKNKIIVVQSTYPPVDENLVQTLAIISKASEYGTEVIAVISKLKLRNPLVVSPDHGGKERAKEFAKFLNTEYITLEKQRDRKTGKVEIKSTNFDEIAGRDLILVDDMISTGGSIIKSTEFLKKQKCARVFVACTHALLRNGAEKKIKNAGVTKIISTNTIPGKTSLVDVSDTIAKAIV